MTLDELRKASKVFPDWGGLTLRVHFHPSIWDEVYDLPNFVPKERYCYSGSPANEFGKVEIFRFILDPDLDPGTWKIERDVP